MIIFENMPPGTPGISLFSTWLRHWKSVGTTTGEALRASDGIMPVLLYIVLHAVSCFIKFTLEHGIDRRVQNNVLSCGARVAWLHGYRDMIQTVSWVWFNSSRKTRFRALLVITVWDVSMSWITWYVQFFLVWTVRGAIRGVQTCLELVSEIVEKRPKSGIFVGGCHVQSHLWAWKPGFRERRASDSKTFRCAWSRGRVHFSRECLEASLALGKWMTLKSSEIPLNTPNPWPQFHAYLPPEIRPNPTPNRIHQ